MTKVPLSNFCEIVQGGRLKRTGADFVKTGFPAYGAGGLNGHLPDFEFCREAIILSAIGARCGKCFYAVGKWSSLANTQLIFPDPAIADAKFLWFQLNDETRWPRSGTGQPFIKPSDVKQHTVYLPPLDEQRRIATILDQADDLRRKRRLALEKLSALPQAIFQEMFGDPALNPKGFKRAALSEIAEFIGGSQPPKTTFLYAESANTVRFVQIRDFRSDEFKTYIPKNLAKRFFENDDIMIGRYGPPVFQIFRGLSGAYNVALMKAKAKTDVRNDFLFYLLKHPTIQNFVVAKSERTAGQSGVNLDVLNNVPVYRPPVELQEDFSRRFAAIKRQRSPFLQQVQKLDQLLAALQRRAFAGTLTPATAGTTLASLQRDSAALEV